MLAPRGAHKRALIALALAGTLVAASLPGQASGPARPVRKLDRALTPHLERDASSIPVVVQFASRPTSADAADLRAAGFAPPFIRFDVVPAVGTAGSASAVRALAAMTRVTYVEYDAPLKLMLDRATQVTHARDVWGAEYKSLNQLHTGGFTGRGVGVAILDSGIDATHPDLLYKPLAEAQGKQPRVYGNYKMAGRNNTDITSLVDDLAGTPTSEFLEANVLAVDMAHTDHTGGHGTHVAGIVGGSGAASGGKYKGAAPEAKLYGFGIGETISVTIALAGFDYVHAHHDELGIRVVTNSWGQTTPGDYSPEGAITKAVQRLVNEDGLVVLFAAGNNGGDGNAISSAPEANIPEVISVANYYDRTGWVDGTSSRGSRTLQHTWPDVAAPGTQIISASATAGPVTYYGTAQDAAFNHLDGKGEPDVVSVPGSVPVMVEQNVEGQDVIVGPYASFTGTSMAAPHVAGVVALMLEANPALTPAQVKEILRATANMVPRRVYETDGYAIGRGVVDAAEAVAVALRMKDGDSLGDALSNALVDSTGSTFTLNAELPRRLVVDSPASGGSVSGASLTVDGRFIAGKVTDDSVPLMPPPVLPAPPSINGSPVMYHQVAGAGVNPLGLAGTTVVAPGETITLGVRTITSKDFALTKDNFTASHVVKKDGVAMFGSPFAATVSPDGTALQSAYNWSVPSDPPAGDYVFEAYATWTATGDTYAMGSFPFTVVSPGVSPPATSSSTVFSDGFEGDTSGWTIKQNAATGPGLLTSWTLLDAATSAGTWAGFHGDSQKMFYAGDVPTALSGNSGLFYEQTANTDLISPAIDLTDLAEAELSYWRAGMSAARYHYLRVYASPDQPVPAWTQIDSVTGDFVNSGRIGDWEESKVNLASYVGTKIRLRFQFDAVSNVVGIVYPMTLVGWYLDDVAVTGTGGIPSTTIVPTFTALPGAGLGSLKTTLSYSALSNRGVSSYEIDFGDGSPVVNKTAPGGVEHTYGVGQWTATLTVTAGDGTTKTSSIPIDVAPVGEVQVRIGNGRWVNAGAASGADVNWAAVLDLTGVPAGSTTIEVRHFDANGRRTVTSIPITVA